MAKEELKVLMGAFEEQKDGREKCISLFDILDNVQDMNAEELNEAIKEAFIIYVQYDYYGRSDINVICKYMFLHEKDEGKYYWRWGPDKKPIPYNHKIMSKIFEYTTSGEIIEYMSNKIKCAFYGSLRKPMYNYIKFLQTYGQQSMFYKKTITIDGYELYDLGSYPGIKDAKPSKKIVVDLFEISEDVYNSIHDMEIQAGFYEDDIIVDEFSYKIFPYAGRICERSLVISGDWVKEHYNLNKAKLRQNDNVY